MPSVMEKIRRKTVNAISDFSLIEENDRILIAVSGGIDSSVLVTVLKDIHRRANFDFSMKAVLVDQKFPNMDYRPFFDWINGLNMPFDVLEFDTFAMIEKESGKSDSPCQICSRMRRGILYTYAKKHDYSKIALGHNRDDLNETLLMNMFYSGRMCGMPPKIKSDDGFNTIIRPFAYVPKDILETYGKLLNIPVVVNEYCDTLPENSRKKIKDLLKDLESDNPSIGGNLLGAQQNIKPSQLLDRKLWKFD